MEKNIVGDRIRIARAIHKPPMSQSDLLAQLQVHDMQITQPALSRMENGQRPVNDYELLILAEVLNVSVMWLLGKTETKI